MIDPVEIAAIFVLAVLVAIYFVFASFLYGAGYQPTPRRVVEKMLEVAAVGPGDRVVDLGAGTGAIVSRAAPGARGDGARRRGRAVGC